MIVEVKKDKPDPKVTGEASRKHGKRFSGWFCESSWAGFEHSNGWNVWDQCCRFGSAFVN